MTQLKDNTNKENIKASKVLEITKYIRSVKAKKKSVCAAFNDEIKRSNKELLDILDDEPTTQEVVNNVNDVHDIEFTK